MAGWFAHTLRPAMLAAGRSDRLGRIVERSPLTRGVVRRFVPGDTLDDVVDIVTALRDSGRYLSIDYLGENVTDADDAAAAVRAYLGLLDVLGRRGDIACDGVRPLEVSLKLSALGQALDRDGQKIALDNARAICERAERVGAWVTVGRRRPHHHRFHIVDIGRFARRLSLAGHGCAGLSAAHAGRLRGVGGRGRPSPVVQGRL